jgi:hypothetical protein
MKLPDIDGSVWIAEMILLRSDCLKLQNTFQEKYLFFVLEQYLFM